MMVDLNKYFFTNKITASIVTNVKHINMAFHQLDVNRVIAIVVVRRDSNVIKMANVRVTTMLKEDVAIDAKKINTIVIKDV